MFLLIACTRQTTPARPPGTSTTTTTPPTPPYGTSDTSNTSSSGIHTGVSDTGTSDTHSTHTGDTTEADTGSTGDSGVSNGLPAPRERVVAPTSIVYGTSEPTWYSGGQMLGRNLLAVPDSNADGRDELLADILTEEFGASEHWLLTITGDGRQHAETARQANFICDDPLDDLRATSRDLTGDGLPDVILGPAIYASPFSHEVTCEERYGSFEGFFAGRYITDVDADDDGRLDLLVLGYNNGATLFYGPLAAGDIVSPMNPRFLELTDASNIAGGACDASMEGGLIGPFAGPSSVVLQVGGYSYGVCDAAKFFDVAGPRNQTWDHGDAVLEDRGGSIFTYPSAGVGDWDGDGNTDAVLLGNLRAGPIGASVDAHPLLIGSVGEVVTSVPDLDGDGVAELLVQATSHFLLPSRGVGRQSWDRDEMALYAVELVHPDPSEGVLRGWSFGDFDGDGLVDVAAGSHLSNDLGGEIYVWSGSNLLAAYP